MEPHCGLCHLLYYASLKLLLTKFYAKLGTLVIGHTGVTHCIARIPTVSNIVFDRFCSFFSRSISSPNIFLRSIFIDSFNFVYSFTGYNFLFGHTHYRHFLILIITLLTLLDKYHLLMALILIVKI